MTGAADGAPYAGWEAALNDAAVQLLAGAGSDAERLGAVRERMAAVLDDDTAPARVRRALGRAIATIDSALDDDTKTADAQQRLSELLAALLDDAPPADPPTPGPNARTLATDATNELLAEFMEESLDYLAQAERAVLELESDATAAEPLNVVFRAFHTIKSSAAFLGLEEISALAHDTESLLSGVRDGNAPFVKETADVILGAADLMRELLGEARAAGADAEPQRGRPDAGVRRAVAPGDEWARVRTGRLDELVDLVGELAIAHAMIAQDPQVEQDRHSALARRVLHASKIVRELQDLSIGLRMVPLRTLFQRLHRVVRDLADRSGKPVQLVTEGADTEIDRALVDVLADPLVHMIRNAVDHGLEAPADRARLGKPDVGTLRLAARQAGGAVIVELRDDGRGLDRERIVRKAVERGLIPPDHRLADADIDALIFAPGMSTATHITELSGRGVGMDVVQRSIESLRGRIEIASEPGAGTTFTLRLPLTLAVTDGMLLRVGGERYIVPAAAVMTSFRPAPTALIREAQGGELVLLHERSMPLVRLHHVFGIGDANTDPPAALLVVIADGHERYALLVDEMLGQQQFVAKPLAAGLGNVPGIAGSAVLGDGRVGLILDPGALLAAARRLPPWSPAQESLSRAS